MLIAVVLALASTITNGKILGPTETDKINTLATRHMFGALSNGIDNLARRIERNNAWCNNEINRIRKYVCSKCASSPVVPSMADIQQNLNRPIPVVLQLFFDVLDGLTPSWMVEQVGERKYMMEEDFRRTANYLKAAISPELGTPQEESNRISREIDEKLGKVASNFQNSGFVGRRKRQSTITMIRSCSDCAGLDGINIEGYIDIVCGPTTLMNIQSILDYADRYRSIFNTTFGNGDPIIQEVDFDESTAMYEFSPFRFEAEMNSYKFRIEETIYTKTSTPNSINSIAFHNLNETAIFMAEDILMKHVYNTVQGFGVA